MSDTLNALGDLLDEHLLRRLTESKSGEGEPLTAAELNVIRQRLKDHGVTGVVRSGSPIGRLAEAARGRLRLTGTGGPGGIPPVDSGDTEAFSVR